MKNKVYLLASLLGTASLLAGCNAISASIPSTINEVAAQKNTVQTASVGNTTSSAQSTAGQQQTLVQDTTPQTAASTTNTMEGYVQIFVDPQTGNLVTVDPSTGQMVPYTLPGGTIQDSTAQTNDNQTEAAKTTGSTQVQPSQTNSSNQTQAVQNNSGNQMQASPSTQSTNTSQAKSTQRINTNQAQAAQSTNTSQTQVVQSTNTNQTQVAQANTSSQTAAAAPATTTYIGESRALQIALNHAGVNSSDTLFSYAHLDFDDGRYEYDVEFYAGNKEYDYNIDAVSGNILSFDYDMESHYTPPVQQQAQVQQQPQVQQAPVQQQAQSASSTAAVSIETAKQTALSRVPGANNSHIRIVTDYDDGRMVYEGKIIYNAMEYDFEISASTGNVIEWDVESIYD